MALVQLTIGPMTLVHPVYVSSLDAIPLFIGKDLLNRFEPLINFKRLNIWAHVRQPLPISLPQHGAAQCCVLDTESMSLKAQIDPPEVTRGDDMPSTTSETSSTSPWHQNKLLAQRDTFLCSFTDSNVESEYCPKVINSIKLENGNINDVTLALG
ncbi:hypothetical protein ABVT39_007652 [Epinephelus coioides]